MRLRTTNTRSPNLSGEAASASAMSVPVTTAPFRVSVRQPKPSQGAGGVKTAHQAAKELCHTVYHRKRPNRPRVRSRAQEARIRMSRPANLLMVDRRQVCRHNFSLPASLPPFLACFLPSFLPFQSLPHPRPAPNIKLR